MILFLTIFPLYSEMLETCIIHSNRIEGEPDDDKFEIYEMLFRIGPLGMVTTKFMKKAHNALFADRIDHFPGQFRHEMTPMKEVYCITEEGNFQAYMDAIKIEKALKELVKECERRFYELCRQMSPEERREKLIDYLAYFHSTFLSIHPFADGNGRTARLFTWCIMKAFFKDPVPILEDDKSVYFKLLSKCDQTRDYTHLKPIFENIPELP